ncbi:MAG: FHA domain-containing protein [Methanoregula sp.]|jgi:DNA-binding transcriptional ArsR family regulator
MTQRKTVSVSTDPDFLDELSEYLEVLSNPVRLRILKVIEREPREISEIASRINTSYANTKKHMDQLVRIGLVKKEAGFGRETVKGIHPVWKFSLAEGSLELLIKNLGVFSRINIPLGFGEIQDKLKSVQAAVIKEAGGNVPALHLMNGSLEGKTYLIKKDHIVIGRTDPDAPGKIREDDIVLPEDYSMVTRISKPHAILSKEPTGWTIEDRGSSGGTYVNSDLISPMHKCELHNGDVIDLALGDSSARFLFVADV